MYSKVEEIKVEDNETQVWTCEFCHTLNTVMVEPEEIQTKAEVNYIVEAAA